MVGRRGVIDLIPKVHGYLIVDVANVVETGAQELHDFRQCLPPAVVVAGVLKPNGQCCGAELGDKISEIVYVIVGLAPDEPSSLIVEMEQGRAVVRPEIRLRAE
ncbi:hypothetical protein EDF27_3925 [Curtobacterium sp. PhB136]|nr:hypothetical protein EDF27_3925 [Curtobacterium sp. PhB136]